MTSRMAPSLSTGVGSRRTSRLVAVGHDADLVVGPQLVDQAAERRRTSSILPASAIEPEVSMTKVSTAGGRPSSATSPPAARPGDQPAAVAQERDGVPSTRTAMPLAPGGS